MRSQSFVAITLPFILWTLLMITVSSLPGKTLPEIPLWNWDKLAHAFEFTVFAFLFFRYLYIRKHRPESNSLILVLVIGICYGMVDELHQLLIPNRACTWQDFVADTAGVIAGGFIAQYYFKRRGNHGSTSN